MLFIKKNIKYWNLIIYLSVVMRGIYYYILCHTVIVIIIFILENPATHQKYKSTHFTQSRGVSIRSVQIMPDSLLGKPRAYFEKKKEIPKLFT